MPTYHASLADQQEYELNLLYKDLKDLPNIMQIQAHFHDRGVLTMVLPDLGVNVYPSTKGGIVGYMRQMLFALQQLWNRDIVHCNIKGGKKPNAIYDFRGKLTLIDFESAVRRHELIDQNCCTYWGNPHYVAPEVLVPQTGCNLYGQTRFGRRRDIFSAGVVFAELLLDIQHFFVFFQGIDDDEVIMEARKVLQENLRNLSPEEALNQYGDFRLSDEAFNTQAAALVAKMLTHDRFARPSPQVLLRDPFFSMFWAAWWKAEVEKDRFAAETENSCVPVSKRKFWQHSTCNTRFLNLIVILDFVVGWNLCKTLRDIIWEVCHRTSCAKAFRFRTPGDHWRCAAILAGGLWVLVQLN